MKGKLSLYLVLFVFGVLCTGIADEVRRAAWAQYGTLAFLTLLAYFFVDGLRPTKEEIERTELGEESERRLRARWAKRNAKGDHDA